MTVLYESHATFAVATDASAEDAAGAFLAWLIERFDVRTAEAAFRTALKDQMPRPPGRRRRPEHVASDAVLLREHRSHMDRGLSSAEATAAVAKMVSDEERRWLGDKGRSADRIKHRIRELLRTQAKHLAELHSREEQARQNA